MIAFCFGLATLPDGPKLPLQNESNVDLGFRSRRRLRAEERRGDGRHCCALNIKPNLTKTYSNRKCLGSYPFGKALICRLAAFLVLSQSELESLG